MSQECYGVINELLGEKGQGNVFSGNVCLFVSCVMFNEMENKRLRIIIKSEINDEEVQILVVAFIDDGFFVTRGTESE